MEKIKNLQQYIPTGKEMAQEVLSNSVANADANYCTVVAPSPVAYDKPYVMPEPKKGESLNDFLQRHKPPTEN